MERYDIGYSTLATVYLPGCLVAVTVTNCWFPDCWTVMAETVSLCSSGYYEQGYWKYFAVELQDQTRNIHLSFLHQKSVTNAITVAKGLTGSSSTCYQGYLDHRLKHLPVDLLQLNRSL